MRLGMDRLRVTEGRGRKEAGCVVCINICRWPIPAFFMSWRRVLRNTHDDATWVSPKHILPHRSITVV